MIFYQTLKVALTYIVAVKHLARRILAHRAVHHHDTIVFESVEIIDEILRSARGYKNAYALLSGAPDGSQSAFGNGVRLERYQRTVDVKENRMNHFYPNYRKRKKASG
jgi:hypothetical protein